MAEFDVAVRVDGLRELQNSFTAADRRLREDLRDALQEAAQPVKLDAQGLAQHNIRGMRRGSPWTRMRTGILAGGTVVYVAPVERGVKGRGGQNRRRPNFADVLRDKAMNPAAQHNRRRVERRLDQMLVEVKAVWERSA